MRQNMDFNIKLSSQKCVSQNVIKVKLLPSPCSSPSPALSPYLWTPHDLQSSFHSSDCGQEGSDERRAEQSCREDKHVLWAMFSLILPAFISRPFTQDSTIKAPNHWGTYFLLCLMHSIIAWDTYNFSSSCKHNSARHNEEWGFIHCVYVINTVFTLGCPGVRTDDKTGKLTRFSPATGSAVLLPPRPAAAVTKGSPETQHMAWLWELESGSGPSGLWGSVCVKFWQNKAGSGKVQ